MMKDPRLCRDVGQVVKKKKTREGREGQEEKGEREGRVGQGGGMEREESYCYERRTSRALRILKQPQNHSGG